MLRTRNRALACAAAAALVSSAAVAASGALAEPGTPTFQPIGSYATGLAGGTSAETSAFEDDRLFVTNSTGNSLDVVDASDPHAPTLLRRIDLSPYGAGPNSVDVRDGLVAVAVEASPKTAPGKVVFFRSNGDFVASATVGALPDMLAFSRRGNEVLVANEGEPSSYGAADSVDPEGSVSIVSTRGLTSARGPRVRTAGFADFNAGGPRNAQLPAGIRLKGPGASVAQDLEPEYIAVSGDTAFVSLQEANAVAEIDVERARVIRIRSLGTKDHSLVGAGLDPSDRDGGISIANWPVRGLYMPDAIASFRVRGKEYVISANEGDGRDHPGFADEVRAGAASVVLDPVVFPNAGALKANAALGRLNISRTDGLNTATGRYEALYSFGARSATIWNARGQRVWDSGDQIERRVAAELPTAFNASNDNNTLDDRSDNKGPEPEGVAVGEIRGKTYAFVGLERVGGFMVFDVSNPAAPALTQWANNRDYTRTPVGPDSGPEVLHFVDHDDSPTDAPLVIVSNEVSGTVTFYEASR
jgi:hypothetical protein